ncbi:chromosome transmission fidelity protein 18 homolog isoform X2 [Thrips palmi]|uniref:Chromosome transmission fidelity protein 18 homolog isoform X2 n=1 Tax=Thrips palmi TaxID=161013 RepID=A0A6P8YJZ6_THRPL|nr:chromosome transmission fidelity protein 18 homolog isoform X2 [Thrips palmi]
MDEDFPNPEEEFEMMYADELAMLQEMEEGLPNEPVVRKPAPPTVRRSLDFCGSSSTQITDVISSTPANSGVEKLSAASPPSRKRTIDDIFGDIDDIELEEAAEGHHLSGKSSKRSCKQTVVDPTFFLDEDPGPESSHGKEMELIDRINDLRKKAFMECQQGHISSPTSIKLKASSSITKGVPKWPFVSVTSELGDRVYVRLRTEEYMDEQCDKVSHKRGQSGLLRSSFSSLKDEALKILEEKQESIIAAQVAELETLETSESASSKTHDGNNNLWVVKYKPTSYAELLSEENVNRTLLHWLKLWDKVVFNKERKTHVKAVKEDKKNQRFQKKPFGQVLTDELDEHGRPQFKMVLLCGPPGLGKTTLAHMVAKLAGYNVVEVNASDDRTPEAFHTQLQAATQMKSVMGKEPRPNCLVLDEIDGAPAVSIETLIKFVSGKNVGKGKGKKKDAGPGILKRPVICICNDPYVPALRSLRQQAFVLHFPPTASERLASRLMTISRKQGIKTDLGAMLALCEKSQNDIRSCLSLLHYFKSQNRSVRLSDIHQSNVGQKDIQRGLFSVWQEVFQIQRSKGGFTQAAANAVARSKANSSNQTPEMKSGDSAIAARIQRVLNTVQSHGDYNRLAQGVFENYPNMRLRDSSLNGIVKGLDWFSSVDLLNTEILSSQNYILMPYMSYAFAVWHILYAGLAWPKINYPNASYEASVKEGHTKQIIGELVKGMSPSVRVNCNETQLIMEILPLLLDVIVPNFRPVSLQLYSSQEKKDFCSVVSTMIDYNLTYVQERTPEGTYVCNLDPNIEEIVYFGESKPPRTLSYGTKQLLSREIEMEKMRRFEMAFTSAQSVQTPSSIPQDKSPPKNAPREEAPGKSKEKVSPTNVPNHLRKLKAKPVLKELQTKDFFGRIVDITLSPSTVKANSEAELKGDIWFHFKEGYNNAVRKTIKISELL